MLAFRGSCKCVCAKMTCVERELNVGVKPAMKLGSRSKVASLRMCIFRDFNMWKRDTPLSCYANFVGQCGVFCAADGCPCFDVLAYSSSTSLTSIHRHSKCTRTFSHRGYVFARSVHQRFPRIPRAPKARAKKNWRFCGPCRVLNARLAPTNVGSYLNDAF